MHTAAALPVLTPLFQERKKDYVARLEAKKLKLERDNRELVAQLEQLLSSPPS